jgi:hypothetical protein
MPFGEIIRVHLKPEKSTQTSSVFLAYSQNHESSSVYGQALTSLPSAPQTAYDASARVASSCGSRHRRWNIIYKIGFVLPMAD